MRRFFGWVRRPGIVLSDNRGGPWGPGGGGGEGGGDGGGGGGPRNPWGPRRRRPEPGGGGRGSRGSGDVTSLDEFLRRSRARFGGGLPGGRPYLLYGIAIAVLLWLAFTSMHRIGPNERGVVTTFGWYSGTLQPGIGFSWPWPIGSVEKVDVTTTRTITVPEGRGENRILTGDQNVINLSYTIRWKINSPERYLYQLENPDLTIREVAESAMRAAVARVSLDDALGAGRSDLGQRVAANMQQILDAYGSGVEIQGVAVSQSVPPQQVNDAFLQVSAAQQRAQSAINDARAYAQQVTQGAQGAAAQFDRIYAQYRLAPDVTRRRMYYETMERILQQVDTTIVEAPGVQPYLPLPQVQGSRSLPAPAPGAGR